jgi:hypothetical protein
MSTPGFTAEASLYRTTRRYRACQTAMHREGISQASWLPPWLSPPQISVVYQPPQPPFVDPGQPGAVSGLKPCPVIVSDVSMPHFSHAPNPSAPIVGG